MRFSNETHSTVLVQLLWSRLDDLSFLTINTMISMTVPGPAQLFLSVMLSLIQADVMFTEHWLPQIFYGKYASLEDSEAMNEFIEEGGYQSMQSVKNLGSTLVYLWVYCASWAVLGLVIFLSRNFAR